MLVAGSYYFSMKLRFSNQPSSVRGRAFGLLFIALASACHSGGAFEPANPHPLPVIQLRSDWREIEPITFEHMVDELLPLDSMSAFEPTTFAELSTALDAAAPFNVRAAVLLTRAGTADCAEALLMRLEKRVNGPDRSSDAGDVVAAAGLADLELETSQIQRLASLSVGTAPHPDLEARVEIARTALRHGQDTVIPFLISVLRIGTRASRRSGEFWPAPLRSAWARERAAEILSWRSGLEKRFSADASISDRETEANRYEQALLGS
ncbi:MAG: hypothetical protein ACI87A_002370 [Planctomycetota bacterium]|jgi:hypothetical protein